MCVNRCAAELSGICLPILYHSRCRKSIVGSAKEYVRELCKMMRLIRSVMVTKVTFDNVCTHPKTYAWMRSAARRWMGRTAKPPGRNGTSRREACGSFHFFCLSSVCVWHWQAAFCRCARSFVYRRSVSRRYLPVHDRSFAATSSGVPVAITVPPPSPPSGPMSMR